MSRPPTPYARPRIAWVAAWLAPVALLAACLPGTPAADARRPEPVTRLGVDAWHTAGHRGKGVKVAVLDSGFRGYRDHLGKALPKTVTVRSFRADGNLEAKDSQHGILCGEVIHALAPEAELLFANWEADCPERFLEAVRWARDQGARVISCSVIMPSWSDGEGGGVAHEALARLLGPGDGTGDLLFFSCAGNTAQRHWSGAYRDGGDGFHAWADKQIDNTLTPWGDDRVSVELCSRAGSGYDLFVYDRETGKEVGCSLASDRKDKGCAVVRFQPEGGHGYRVRARLAEGPSGPFHFFALSSGLEVSTAGGSLPFPADGPEVVSVGAVDDGGRRMGYSSCGPNSPQPKPDLVAPVPFPSGFRDRPFGGTSAAAPQAAAVAALCWSRHAGWKAGQVRSALRAAARDLAAPGHDCETGYGSVHLPAVSADWSRLAREKDPARAAKKPG